MRNEGTLFAALAVGGFYKEARFPPGYFNHQFLLDVLELLAVTEDDRGVERIKREYFRQQELGSLLGVLPGLSSLIGRFMIKQPAFNFASLNSQHAPTYMLSFEYQGSHSYFDLLAPPGSRDLLDPGISHGDDLLYLFYTGILELGIMK